MATVYFSPDKADHANALDYDRSAPGDGGPGVALARGTVGAVTTVRLLQVLPAAMVTAAAAEATRARDYG